MPWDESKWDHDLLAFYKRMIAIRKESYALRCGGFEQIAAEGDLFAFQREAADERVVVIAYRGQQALRDLTLPVAAAGIADGTSFTDLLSEKPYTVSGGSLSIGEIPPRGVLVLRAK
jgi:alpha-glucosidase